MSSKINIQDLKYGDAEHQIRRLQGQVLTIIDAVIIDKNQNKATKDLIKSRFSNHLNNLWRIAISEIPSIYSTGEKNK